jgi:hypothetical protein
MIVNGEQVRIWQGTVIAYFNVLSLERLKKIMKISVRIAPGFESR